MAHHIFEKYGYRGYVWFATYEDYAIAWTTSNSCNAHEVDAYDRVEETTKGYYGARWPSGIRMRRYEAHACDGTVNKYVDIELSYESASNFVRSDGSTYGGYNESFLAPRSWCEIWGKVHPCGSHPSVVHLNRSRFGDSGYSNHYKRRLIMHETGHSFGLAHHCSGDSVMNDGTSGCNGGAFTNINGYQQTDRDGIHDLYPGWKYR